MSLGILIVGPIFVSLRSHVLATFAEAGCPRKRWEAALGVRMRPGVA